MNIQVTALVGTGPGKREYAQHHLPDAVVADMATKSNIWYSVMHPDDGIVIFNVDRLPEPMACIVGMMADRGHPLIVTLRDERRIPKYLGHRNAEIVFFDSPTAATKGKGPKEKKEKKEKGKG